MTIKIDKDKDVDVGFVSYVIKKLQQSILQDLNVKKLIVWDEFLAQLFQNNKLVKNPSAKEVIYLGCHYIRFLEFRGYYLIEIDPNVIYKHSLYTVSALCRLIDRGTLGMKGYPIFSNNFRRTQKKLSRLKKSYKLEGYMYARIRVI